MEYKLKIKEYRQLRNMTQLELAEKSACHQTRISQLEKNSPCAKSPTLKTIFRIAVALDVCPHILIEYNYECNKNCINNCHIS